MARSKLAPIFTAALAALGVIAGAGCSRNANGRTTGAARASAPIPVRAAAVESKVLPRVLEVTGALTADESADVASERDGNVASVRVERGTYVEKGAVLATLDDRDAKAQLDQARATLAWAESEVRAVRRAPAETGRREVREPAQGNRPRPRPLCARPRREGIRRLHDPRAVRGSRHGEEGLGGRLRAARPGDLRAS